MEELFDFDKPKIICGTDEAGRGPLAGPVTAAAVVLPSSFPFEILADSKKLSHKQLIEAEKVGLLLPDKPNSPNQKYYKK